MFIFKNHIENEAGRLALELFLYFKKTLYEAIASGLRLSFSIFWLPSTWHNINTNCMKFLDYWSRDMISFYILEEGLGTVSPSHFLYVFSNYILCFIFLQKMFIKLYSINWPNFILWLPLRLEKLCNMSILIVPRRHQFWN